MALCQMQGQPQGTSEGSRNVGPVSEALEKVLRGWIQRHSMVVWLDLDESYTDFVDALAQRDGSELGYQVRAHRGSYLDLLMALEDLTGGVEPPRLLVHLPGMTEETVKSTPLYELYKAGVRRRKSLATLITEAATGQVPPDEIAAFVSQTELSLEGADTWLRALQRDREGGLSAQLQVLSPTALLDDLLQGGFIATRLGSTSAEDAVWAHLGAALALPLDWRREGLGLADRDTVKALSPADVAFAMASWALAVEYVEDLKRPPVMDRLVPIQALPRGVKEACQALAAHLRDRHPDTYRRTADETETLLGEEEEVAMAQDLGDIDTFRFEEKKVLADALEAMGASDWGRAVGYASRRVDAQRSFWIREDPLRQSAWELVAAGAHLGAAIAEAGPRLEAVSHEEAAARYVEMGAKVDRAHRELEQLRAKLLGPRLPGFETLRSRLDSLRRAWRAWADGWATGYCDLCRKEGFLPPAELRQRNLFDQVVRPNANDGTTAYFVVDAMRFEMGQALFEELADTPSTLTKLEARFAELPSNTEVGMNVLAPVAASGKLHPAVRKGKVVGFSSGEFRVKDPDTRRRAMFERVGGDTCPWLSLSEVLNRDAKKLKATVARARLLVVHSEEIDLAGEKGVGAYVFDSTLQQLRSAWRLLRDAGVKRFVMTSDHGFLLLDGHEHVVQAHGRPIDPKRRHVFTEASQPTRDGEVQVSFAELDYEGAEGHLTFPVTTAPFDTGKRRRSFVHGGNSLQERLIPVLTLVHRAASGGSSFRYAVSAEALDGVADMHCLKAKVEPVAGQGRLAFGSEETLELALHVPEQPEVAVELCQARYGGQLQGGALSVTIGEEFELFFRLAGPLESRARVELHHPSKAVQVEPGGPKRRFRVTALAGTLSSSEEAEPDVTDDAEPTNEPSRKKESPEKDSRVPPPAGDDAWLEELPNGVRDVFRHIALHDACVEDEAVRMLGGARKLRRFSAKFEEYASLAPFEVEIKVVGGVKRYVKA